MGLNRTQRDRLVDLSYARYDSETRWPEGFRYTRCSAIGPGTSIAEFNLYKAELPGIDLRDAILHMVRLTEADLRGANLSGADLTHAEMNRADLRSANLRGADLRDVTMIGADLQGADLSEANLCGANLLWANLTNAILKDTITDRFTHLIRSHI
ncbi:MAG: pentapeptide repeat-containing protein [Myxococcota bacterium]